MRLKVTEALRYNLLLNFRLRPLQAFRIVFLEGEVVKHLQLMLLLLDSRRVQLSVVFLDCSSLLFWFLVGLGFSSGSCAICNQLLSWALQPTTVNIAALVERLLVITAHQLDELNQLLQLVLLLLADLARPDVLVQLTFEIN